MIYQGSQKYPVHEVILHTAALSDPAAFFEAHPTATSARDEIDRWHKGNGWRGIGYHWVVMPDGSIAMGRPMTEIGAHVKERNRGTVGICMLNVRPHHGITKFEDYFTGAQRRAVRDLIDRIAGQTDLKWVTGHNDYTNMKECPGFRVVSEDWMPKPDPARFSWLRNLLSLFNLKGN